MMMRLCAAAATTAWVLSLTPIPVRAAQPGGMQPTAIAEQYQQRGGELYDRAEYLAAARTWARILETLSENEVNRAERDNALLITLDAYMRPYERYHFGSRTGEPPPEVVEGLEEGVRVYERYLAAYRRAYGETAQISPSAQEVARQLLSFWEEVRGSEGSESAERPGVDPRDGWVIDGCDRRTDRCYQRGVPLIVVGSVSLGLGLGATSMIVVGGLRARDNNDATAKGLIIGGSVATVALLTAGGVMLGVGIRRRGRRIAVSPMLGPGLTGLSMVGRF